MAAGGVLGTAGTSHADGSSGFGRVPGTLRPGGELDRYIAQMAAEDRFSGTVLLTHRNRPVLSRSHGWADRARRIANGPETRFVVGSIAKTFTAVAIAQLAARGEVAYGGTVGAYLDGFPAEIAQHVTVHQMLTHTSGLGDFYSAEFVEQAKNWDTVEEFWDGLMAVMRTLKLEFTPGTRTDYSNAGFIILGGIVAQMAGSYYDHMRSRLFTPAGMDSSDFSTKPEVLADRRVAHPYALQDGEHVDIIDSDLLIGTPAGGAYASAPDMVRFAHAFQDGATLLDRAGAQLVASPKLPPSTDNDRFAAYGLTAHLTNGQWSYAKNGGFQGASNNIEWFPESGWVAAVLCNYADSAEPVSDKARELIADAR
ncbi:serine hydrolase [Streptomyces sp. WMMC500]|uniref:serine hydrolase domain-containing protein n=1 Tax=Streptomyces sp. WMMC500 TaxID=3015154 RepID=UPI00248B1039|nr:serine hydrolase domain-containing protein [Streptomyces sp. WMMC500]WBB63806.1 serine hydrolase [Streptomyces sp. WMMC500]